MCSLESMVLGRRRASAISSITWNSVVSACENGVSALWTPAAFVHLSSCCSPMLGWAALVGAPCSGHAHSKFDISGRSCSPTKSLEYEDLGACPRSMFIPWFRLVLVHCVKFPAFQGIWRSSLLLQPVIGDGSRPFLDVMFPRAPDDT